jgi:hypothetical protein
MQACTAGRHPHAGLHSWQASHTAPDTSMHSVPAAHTTLAAAPQPGEPTWTSAAGRRRVLSLAPCCSRTSALRGTCLAATWCPRSPTGPTTCTGYLTCWRCLPHQVGTVGPVPGTLFMVARCLWCVCQGCDRCVCQGCVCQGCVCQGYVCQGCVCQGCARWVQSMYSGPVGAVCAASGS